jgi:putative peptidoglycan lipid II flippase
LIFNRANTLSKKLLKSTAIVSAMTFLSRILGFIRDVIFARFLGADAATDAFFVAFKIPNFFRRLFAEGAFIQAFVPVLSEYKENGSQAALKTFINRTGGTLALILMLVTVVGVIAAPLFIMAFAPGFSWQGDSYDLAVQLLRITFPYLFFIASTAFAAGILNTHGQFAIPAITPVLLNICLISAAIWFAPKMDEPVIALAWGVFIAGAVQLVFQFPALWRLDLLPRLHWGFADEGVRRILKLMIPALFGVSITQLNLLLDTLIASFLTTGSISWLYYSDRLVEFPLGVFGIALATVILPSLSKRHANKQPAAFSAALDWGMRWVVLIGLPASLALLLLAEPLLATLFQYDEFTDHDVVMAARSLMAYSVGLMGFISVKILVPGFTARQDMRTPVRIGMVAIFANMLFNIILVFPLAHAGLALATALASFVNAGLLYRHLRREKIYNPIAGWGRFWLSVIVANLAMVVVLYIGVHTEEWLQADLWQRIFNLSFWIGLAIIMYFSVLALIGIRPHHLMQKSVTI